MKQKKPKESLFYHQISPSEANLLLSNELAVHKDLYDNMMVYIERVKEKKEYLEYDLATAKNEARELEEQLKEVKTQGGVKEKTYQERSQISEYRDILTSPVRREYTTVTPTVSVEMPLDEGVHMNKEWQDILRYVNIGPKELDRLANHDKLDKIIEAVELLNKLLMDKNKEIRELKVNVTELLNENAALNNENYNLEDLVREMKHKLSEQEADHSGIIAKLQGKIKELERNTPKLTNSTMENTVKVDESKTSRQHKIESLLSSIKVKNVISKKNATKEKTNRIFAVPEGQTQEIDTLFISDALDLNGLGFK